MSDRGQTPELYTVVRATWLSPKPHARARPVAVFSALALGLGCALYWTQIPDMAATRAAVFDQHQYWRLFTTLFAHGDLGHLLSNSLMFVIFGYLLSGYFGVMFFPVTALIFGAIGNALALLTYSADTRLIGASGLVYWMGAAWLTLYCFIHRQRSPRERTLRAIGAAVMLFAPTQVFDPEISYRTHAIGFFLGGLWGAVYFFAHRSRFRAAEITETLID